MSDSDVEFNWCMLLVDIRDEEDAMELLLSLDVSCSTLCMCVEESRPCSLINTMNTPIQSSCNAMGVQSHAGTYDLVVPIIW